MEVWRGRRCVGGFFSAFEEEPTEVAACGAVVGEEA